MRMMHMVQMMQAAWLTAAGTADGGGWDMAWLILLVIAAAALGLYLWFSGRHARDRRHEAAIEALEAKYEELSLDMLSQIPDGELVRAVIANLLSKLDDYRNQDAYAVIPGLSHGRCAVYSVWLVTNEQARQGLRGYMDGYTANFAALAADGFALIGAEGCARALDEAMEAASDAERDEADGRFAAAAVSEKPLELCGAYIRANPDEFIDYAVESGDADTDDMENIDDEDETDGDD